MEEHRWSVSDIGRASDVAIPRDSGAERGSPITCPADVTARGERYEIINNRNSTLPSESSKDNSQGLYHLSPSFNPPESIASSVAAGLSSIPETGPSSFPNFFRVQQAEDVSLSIPTIIPLQSPSWDPLAPVSAALPMTNFYHRSMHQEPSTPVPLQTTMNHHETKPSSFDDMGANSQDSSWNVKVPEDQVEHRHST
ncbi:hypothetical protein ASPNIDRAFT_46146 [Aspergillus niger ATCC 1015]|uniref:Uncharacterized protein n=1 Tax=Aspergillus niger (strain ATCC 1015 / CBS 113.46 / FGSC A1144 / LSHB Ac4 / NCTC 3858a / NRRL 328 / USDA 3528.7) TaxID=380704 RepID=G3YHN8_ASPNA|nr:hypothetical protein ASPNIDRAFT_46146 [Aspergillus niger ATCC 1015]